MSILNKIAENNTEATKAKNKALFEKELNNPKPNIVKYHKNKKIKLIYIPDERPDVEVKAPFFKGDHFWTLTATFLDGYIYSEIMYSDEYFLSNTAMKIFNAVLDSNFSHRETIAGCRKKIFLARAVVNHKMMADEQKKILDAQGLIICSNCKKEIPSDSGYCKFCGAKIIE